MHRALTGRLAAVLITFCALALAPAFAQEALKIADEVNEVIETPHPYPSGGPGLVPVWSHTFHWPEASYIAIRFDKFELAPGDVLVLRDPEGRYRHTYTGRGLEERGGDFWGLSILGDTMEVLLFSRNEDHDAYGIVIDRWAHGYPIKSRGAQPDALCGSEDFRDIECYESTYPAEYEKSRAAVRLIKNGSAHCTGWLASCENHIITNEHCVSSQSELDTIEFQFEYKRPNCGSGTASVELQLQGGTFLRDNSGLDYALIMPELAGNDPQSTYGYMQIETRLPDVGEFMYIPGHPSGDPKRLSIESTHPNDPTGRCEVHSVTEPACTGGPVPDVGYYCDTEGGSSGSPVLSSETNKVIALHHCANCPNRGVPIVDVFNDIQASPTPLPACSTCEPTFSPTDLISSTPADNQVQLSWTGVPDAVAYHVYRSNISCDEGFEKIGTTTDTSYLDDAVGGGITYYYRVTSESDCGAESSLSDCTIITPDGDCTQPPEFAGLESAVTAREETCGIELSWSTARALCGAARYNVYRSTVPDFEPGPGNLIARCVPLTRYTDNDVQSETRYWYAVRAEDEADTGSGPCSSGNEESNTTIRSAEATGLDEVFFQNDFTQTVGWLLTGEWQIAAPQGLGGAGAGGAGNPDPSTAVSGSKILGLDLTGKGAALGNYENSISPEQSATSPVINASQQDKVWLRFERWLNVNAAPGDTATIEVCGTSSCEVVWANPEAPLHDAEWTTVNYDISDLVGNTSTTRIRFTQNSDSSGHASGWNIDKLELFAPTTCLETTTTVAPVPDGHLAPGQPMRATRGSGENVDMEWDAEACSSLAYHLFYGNQGGLATGTYEGARCDLGTSGAASVEVPTPEAGGLTWWVLAGAKGDIEGIHGYSSSGAVRAGSANGLCQIAEQSTSGTCP